LPDHDVEVLSCLLSQSGSITSGHWCLLLLAHLGRILSLILILNSMTVYKFISIFFIYYNQRHLVVVSNVLSYFGEFFILAFWSLTKSLITAPICTPWKQDQHEFSF